MKSRVAPSWLAILDELDVKTHATLVVLHRDALVNAVKLLDIFRADRDRHKAINIICEFAVVPGVGGHDRQKRRDDDLGIDLANRPV